MSVPPPSEAPSEAPQAPLALRTQNGRTLVPVRVAFGLLLCWQTITSIRVFARDGYFREHFHMPDIPDSWALSHSVYVALLAARLFASLLIVFGRSVRLAFAVSGVALLYTFASDRLQFHHNRYSLALFAILLALSAPRGRGREAIAAFPAWLARIQVSLIYLASSGSKLCDPDWRRGIVLADRIARHANESLARGVPSGVLSALSSPHGSSLLALATIGTELSLSILLWHKRWRKQALYVGLCFHLLIELTSRVELFSWVMLSAYGFFVREDVFSRTIHYENRGLSRLCARLLLVLDWFGRFRMIPFEPDGRTPKGQTLVLTDRDGRRYVGKEMAARTASATPLLFPLWPALSTLAFIGRSRTRAKRATNERKEDERKSP